MLAEHQPMAQGTDRTISTSISPEEQAVSDHRPAIQTAPVILLWTENPVMTVTDSGAVAGLLLREANRLHASADTRRT